MITDPLEFQSLMETLSTAVIISAKIPAQVFRPGYGHFQFLEFDLAFHNMFWASLQRLTEHSGDSKICIAVLDPAPYQSYADNGHFGALELDANASADHYRTVFTDFTMGVVWFPPSLRWLVWGERLAELMVLAYADGFQAPHGHVLAETGVTRLTAEGALDDLSRVARDRKAFARFAKEFMDNYGGGRHWTDDTPARTLLAAQRLLSGEIGIIEGCRGLSSLGWNFGPDMEGHFSPFVKISRQTNHLPIGGVRRYWAPQALAEKDREIHRFEQLYKQQTFEACRNLMDRLQSMLGTEEV